MLHLPPGHTEAQVLAAIEEVVAALAKRKAAFGFYDKDDLAQEIRIWSIQALPRFDPKIRPLQNFLFTHCKHRLINLHRNKVRRNDPPCSICHASFLGTGDGHPNGEYCEKYAAWMQRNNAKANLMKPVDLEKAEEVGDGIGTSATEAAEASELRALIDERLPLNLRATYLRMLAGETVPPHQRRAVQDAVRDILDGAGLPVPPEEEDGVPKTWTDADHDFIRQNFESLSDRKLAAALTKQKGVEVHDYQVAAIRRALGLRKLARSVPVDAGLGRV